MDKSQALDYFWNQFNIPAFDEASVPDDTPFPYITYSVITDSLNNVVNLNASIWDKSTSWKRISVKADEIAQSLGENGYNIIKLDEGYVWLVKGVPFAQRMADPEKDIKRIFLNVQAEFLTAY